MATVTKPDVYMERVADAIDGKIVNGKPRLEFRISSVDEAKLEQKKIVQRQKKLRQIKREMNQDMKNIRAAYKEASDNAHQSAGSSIRGGLFGRKKGRKKSDVAKQRRELTQKREKELAPYNKVSLTIDDLLIQLDGAKPQIADYIKNESK